MRRVIDDTHYNEIAKEIYNVVKKIPVDEVSEYDWGMYRAQKRLIMEYILKNVDKIKFGKDMNTTGIGNNGCYEIIYIEDNEEQICGLIYITNNMYGGQIVWVSDYDNYDRTPSRTIRGCNPNDEYDMKHKRF